MPAITKREAGSFARVCVLADNVVSPPLVEEHGFSAFIEFFSGSGNSIDPSVQVPQAVILFDTGRGALFENSELMGVDLSRVTDVVLSHGHYDHTDALPAFLREYPGVNVHLSELAYAPHFSMRGGSCTSPWPEETRATLAALPPDQLHYVGASGSDKCNSSGIFADGILSLTGAIPRISPFEFPSPLLFSNKECTIPDIMHDEIFLTIRGSFGLFVLTGCCHAGIVNTCMYAKNISNDMAVHTVMGGFHLAGVSSERMDATIEWIQHAGVSRVIPLHCTGAKESAVLAERLGSFVEIGHCGKVLEIQL